MYYKNIIYHDKNVLIITKYYPIQLIIIQPAITSVIDHWDFSSDYKNN